ncbi:hypothetical protein [Cecembia calidifontis]|jgi:uncharacterized Tic20 family protein|uniref:Uncharacterized protein n=1 Tax=Cecembia calidifontis TaxID=1187080 RepID=A0A4Q7PAR8_9BACT|nr:hypothetical protein [Cecembia calidifontis]RZS97057.1 hypothetical protein BC751_2654 [Cecembia calidifontis]
MTQAPIDILFSILFLLLSYFFSVLALIHVYIPGGIRQIKGLDQKIREVVNFPRVFGISLLIASLITGIMFYTFIYPSYR